MTRSEAKQAYYDRCPVEVRIISIGWIRYDYIDQLIYSRPDNAYADRNIEHILQVRAIDIRGHSVIICDLNNIRKAQV